MIKWLKDNWQWALLNLFGVGVAATLLWQANQEHAIAAFSKVEFTSLVNSGKWAIRFLLFSLLMTPLNTLFGWRWAVKLRKPAGLWAFEFGALHFVFNLADISVAEWLKYPIPDLYAALGVVGLTILTAMAITSSKWAMREMGKWWKRLHRLVYAAGVILVAHIVLESTNKKVAITDWQFGAEAWLYAAILAVLLIVRIPAARSAIAGLRHQGAARQRVRALTE